jgi:hypothetical protein
MRTQATMQEEKTFYFKMNDQDVLKAVDEVNQITSDHSSLKNKKDTINAEMKKLTARSEERMSHVAARSEPRKVVCDIIFDYQSKVITTAFNGEEMESRRMTDYEYACRPTDVFPEVIKSTVEEVKTEKLNDNGMPTLMETALEVAEQRAEEIARKEANNQFPASNINAFSEAKTETSVLNGFA